MVDCLQPTASDIDPAAGMPGRPRTERVESDRLPAPEVIAREIVDDLTAAPAEFEAVAAALEEAAGPGERTAPQA